MLESVDTSLSAAASDTSAPPAPSPQLAPTLRRHRRGPWIQTRSSHGFEWMKADLPVPGLPHELNEFRILHLSDFHARRKWDPAYDDLLHRVEANPPDLILYTGDFIDNKYNYRSGLPTVQRLVAQLKSRLGFVGILGNHDRHLRANALAELKTTLIDEKRMLIQSGSASIELIGLGGVRRDELNEAFLHSIGPRAHNSIRVILSHYPDQIRKSAFLKPDLYLTGHTHGGQICLPGGIPLMRHDALPRRWCTGIHRALGTWLVVNRGFGYSGYVPVRLFCPAEVIEIRLRNAIEK